MKAERSTLCGHGFWEALASEREREWEKERNDEKKRVESVQCPMKLYSLSSCHAFKNKHVSYRSEFSTLEILGY